VEERRLRDLSGDTKVKPGELAIEFFGAEDLAAKLLELSKAMSNDWPAFSRAVEDGGKEDSLRNKRSASPESPRTLSLAFFDLHLLFIH
jgi:hypothetical protein